MKKYVKPELFYEHFELSQHIADCAWEWANYTQEDICHAEADPKYMPGFQGPDYNLFESYPVCTLTSDWYTAYCYQNDEISISLFKS